jgi:hypothetical protein
MDAISSIDRRGDQGGAHVGAMLYSVVAHVLIVALTMAITERLVFAHYPIDVT